VIVGGGFAGAYCARELERVREAGRIRITLIDRSDYLLFYPLLVEAGIGTLELRHVVAPIRSFAGKADSHMAEVVGVDLDRKRAACRDEVTGARTEIEYDHYLRRAVRCCPSLRPGDDRMTLVERDDRILSALDPGLADYACGQWVSRPLRRRSRPSARDDIWRATSRASSRAGNRYLSSCDPRARWPRSGVGPGWPSCSV
jgi:NADH dehydrogenase FAD-containing subunit